ncbi:ral guanine nucleotide dissociation stimulator-like [Equus caballus]|uniref:ral guanine nucleotide dissociation stimulator-like n=1 Tax=Equus caballus TaxID=9796 RepID=UPI0038B288B7
MESVTETPGDRKQLSWELNQLIHHVTPRGLYSLSCMQEVVEELADGFGYSISLDRGSCTAPPSITRAALSAIYFLLGTWLGQEQDCREPLRFPCWTLQLASLHISFGGSHVEGHAYLLPGHLEHLKAIEAKQKEPEPEPEPAPELEPAPAPAPPPVAEFEPASPASDPTGLEEGPPLTSAPVPAPELEPTGPWAVTTEKQLREEKLNLLDFPPRLVAEQLRRMEAELFKKLVPAHCLGSILSQRDNKDCEYLAPTIGDTVAHTNTMANSVIATCLGAPGMTAQERARVVELWIHVAKGCRGLRNFSSFHMILSALQIPAIKHLKDTWGQVSRERSYTFKKWYRGEQHVSRRLLLKVTWGWTSGRRGVRGGPEHPEGILGSEAMVRPSWGSETPVGGAGRRCHMAPPTPSALSLHVSVWLLSGHTLGVQRLGPWSVVGQGEG